MTKVFDKAGNEIDRKANAWLARISWIRPLPKNTTEALMGYDAKGILLGVRFVIRFRQPVGGFAATARELVGGQLWYEDSKVHLAEVCPWTGKSLARTKALIVDRVRQAIATRRGDAAPYREE